MIFIDYLISNLIRISQHYKKGVWLIKLGFIIRFFTINRNNFFFHTHMSRISHIINPFSLKSFFIHVLILYILAFHFIKNKNLFNFQFTIILIIFFLNFVLLCCHCHFRSSHILYASSIAVYYILVVQIIRCFGTVVKRFNSSVHTNTNIFKKYTSIYSKCYSKWIIMFTGELCAYK